MPEDMLVKIFMSLNTMDMIDGVRRVCSSWRHAWRVASSDPNVWKTIDLGMLQSNFIKTIVPPYIWVSEESDKKLMHVLKMAFKLSGSNVRTLIFDINLYLKNEHLTYVAQRSPHLKRLVLPACEFITASCIEEAVLQWPELESLTVDCIGEHFLIPIGNNCKNFTELKIMEGPFDIHTAANISFHFPKLKVLSLRCSLLQEVAINYILKNMKHLEVLNLSHSLFVIDPQYPEPKWFLKTLDSSILEKASPLKQLITCGDICCALCQSMTIDEGYLRWYKFKSLWRTDEVSSLACLLT
ncbi:F-box/LRR-repeat protein [Thalictrum thalictroides]|uniref:F-box/LRR-repeat protein n=1 Tax=Thalictrum thalictroides TaxID=46969 RepID=A0A7J6VNE5_THATH|nr:F-box/LRR-repeat protein [Thalictrum thalictroides]